jgi:hemerythrin-like metal-binding protein
MIINWSSEYEMGISFLDKQHKRLISIINRLEAVRGKIRNTEAVENILQELLNYSSYHFAIEECAMQKNRFPRLDAYRVEHEHFINTVNEFYFKVKRKEKSFILSDAIDFLSNWLLDHIKVKNQSCISGLSEWFVQNGQ